ncbi:MAG TPA: hypothetical protein VK791_00055 [bacterium]|nr:hypothetical protein [bacterium]
MTLKIKDFFEVFLFSTLTLSLYILFIFTIPIAREPHGWIALNGFDNPLWSGGIDALIFGSALICALLGALMMYWVPVLSSEVIRNLWVLTYFFVWVDTVFVLSMEYQTVGFLLRLILGIVFIFIFFYVLQFLGFQPQFKTMTTNWKIQLVEYWTWGWMSFYFSISLLLIYNSFKYSDFRLPLAFGALSVCFMNYIFSLFMQKAEGKKIEAYSKIARIVFIGWVMILILSVGLLR